MPVYEYECDVCGTRFDLKRRFGDSKPVTCPNGHSRVHRVFAPPTIIFKGSGFYVTDNGRQLRHRPSDESSEKSKTGKSDKQEAKTDSAPSSEKSEEPKAKTESVSRTES
jgi:putative FmdB family regulatory protein